MLALALVLPFFTGQIPEIGNMLLPMHLPVMLSGFVVGGPAAMLVGFVAAFASGCLACKFMINIVRKQKLIYFAIYCLCMGVFAIVYGLC